MKRIAVLLVASAAVACSGSSSSIEYSSDASVAADSCGEDGCKGDEDPVLPPDSCGDGTCSADDSEYCTTCPADCGECGTCGDGECEMGVEECEGCPQDCGECGTCGDGTCDESEAEDCATCAADCGACAGCGDQTCDKAAGEGCATCPADCGVCDPCGDGDCDKAGGESCSTCVKDCGVCNPCGDGVCEPGDGEDCNTCPKDCTTNCVRKGCVQGDFKAYWGNLHAHTSYSDGEKTPKIAFEHAKAAGLDFMWITEHKGQMSPTQWTSCKTMADNANVDGTFTAGCGYEIVILTDGGAQLGHFNFLFVGRMIPAP
ncbi:MAG TPA: hypothetical protein PLI95_19130, partial [Polyangiaceae bacterium]|nr:hypothetical protein [Polyangiaceae bacterium]